MVFSPEESRSPCPGTWIWVGWYRSSGRRGVCSWPACRVRPGAGSPPSGTAPSACSSASWTWTWPRQ